MRRTYIDIRPEAYLLLCVSLLLLPFKLVFAWMVSAAVHESFHYAALRLCRCAVPCVRVGAFGAKMETGYLTPGKELICAAAGPLSGIILLLFVKYIPLISVFGLLHSIFNLIPMYPLDGGRVTRCLVKILSGENRGERIAEVIDYAVAAVLLGLAIWGMIKLILGPMPLICVILLIWKNYKVKCSCKQGCN